MRAEGAVGCDAVVGCLGDIANISLVLRRCGGWWPAKFVEITRDVAVIVAIL